MSNVHEFDVIELPPEPLMRESERPQMGDVYLKSYVFPEIGMPWSDMPVQGGYSDWEAYWIAYSGKTSPIRPISIPLTKFEPSK